jgi:hypothetical protein
MRRMAYTAAVILASAALPTAGADFDHLIRLIPPGANVVVAVDVASVFASPLAQSEQWRSRYADAFETTPLLIPPHATRFLLGADMEIATMHPRWEIAAIEMDVDRSVQEVAERTGGTIDNLAGLGAVSSPRFGYIVRFAPRTYGVTTRGGRQAAARWVKESLDDDSERLSPYLREAISFVERNGTEIILAMDLQDALRINEIQDAVQRSDLIADADKQAVVEVLSGLRGITLGIRIDNKRYGRLKVDFARDASALGRYAKPMILRALKRTGAMLDEFEQWEPVTRQNQISIAGDITEEGIRRLLSLLTLDTGIESPIARQTQSPLDQTAIIARRTKRYFDAVNRYIDSLEKPHRNKTIETVTLWLNNYARKIDRLPTYNVDPEMVQYGNSVADHMRQAITVIQGIDERTQERLSRVSPGTKIKTGALPTGNVVNYGGYYRVREYVPYFVAEADVSALQERQRIGEDELQQSADEAYRILDEMRYMRSNVSIKMEEKYKIDFGS